MSTTERTSAAGAPPASSPAGTPEGATAAARPTTEDLERLRDRLQEVEETLRAIRLGEVDALVIQTPEGPRTYTLVTADESYRMLVEQMHEPALTVSNDGLILYSNGRLSALLGLERDRLAGRALADLAPEEGRAAVSALVESGRTRQVSAEVALRHENGSLVPFQLSLSPLATGTFRGICALATDLTELRQRERAAAEERLTRAILEFAGTPIMVCDAGGRILRANRVAGELFGASLAGGSFDRLFPAAAAFAALCATGDAEDPPELVHTTPDGRHLYVQARARSIAEGPPSEGTRWVVTLVDVTHAHEMEEARARLLEAERLARAEAEAANLAKMQFLAVMSHELRTPLTAIIGYADLIVGGVGGRPAESHVQYVERIKGSAWHLLHLIEGILAFARVEAGKETTTIERADIVRVAYEALALVQAQAQSSGLELVVQVPETLAAPTDHEKLRQILANLLANAVKFTRQGRVELRVERSGDYAFCYVSDTGPGIAPEHLARIFEPFVQVDQSPTRKVGGTGLGLAIARHFAELIGAELTVTSELGVGSRFTVKVPLQ
ncbi:MAG TPA: ATP-binding protein [Longimicrobiales bacterium]